MSSRAIPARTSGASRRSRTRSPFPNLLPKRTYPWILLVLPNDNENDGHNEIGHNVSRNSKRHEPKSKALGQSNKDVKKLNHMSDAKAKPRDTVRLSLS